MKPFIFLFIGCCLSANIYAQDYQKGLVFDDAAYDTIPMQATLLTRDYEVLPQAASLKSYCPTPGNQGKYGTCTAWSTAYAACSILAAQANGWQNQPQKIAQEAFSPGFLYYHIKSKNDYNCSNGSNIENGLNTIIQYGIPKKTAFNIDCATSIPYEAYANAKQFKIKTYNRLFNGNDSKNNKLRAIKKALSEKHPVLIGMQMPNSFSNAKEYWTPAYGDSPNCADNCGHAMCVIGYDDKRQAFELINSWATTWGNGGFTWVRYDDFDTYVKYGFEVIPTSKPKPAEIVTPETPLLDLSGYFYLLNDKGKTLLATPYSDATIPTMFAKTYYKTNNPVYSGDKYRIYLTNSEPAYVYVLASDKKTAQTTVLFPNTKKTSAYLPYSTNNIAIPSEEFYNQFDNTLGKDYTCVLYSHEKLNIYAIAEQMSNLTNGSFAQRLETVLGNKIMNMNSIMTANGALSFRAQSKTKNVAALILEIEHR